MSKFNLTILTPKGVVFDDQVVSIVAPGANGFFGVLANHAPMIAATTAGVLKVADGKDRYFAMGSGIVEVAQNNVNILADSAEAAESREAAKLKSNELD